MDVIATGAHVLVARGVDVVELPRLSRDGVQPEVSAPQVAVPPLLAPLVVDDDPRRVLPIPARHMTVKHVSRLADVVINTHEDEVVGVRGATSIPN
jgi:hypothetical protein